MNPAAPDSFDGRYFGVLRLADVIAGLLASVDAAPGAAGGAAADAGSCSTQWAGRSPTRHIVTVPAEDAARLTGGKVATEYLVKRSFDFLLEREPNTSILRSFELSVIGRYFPEYERVIQGML